MLGSPHNLVFVCIFFLAILGNFIDPRDTNLVVVERSLGFSSGGPVLFTGADTALQGSFLGVSGFAESQTSLFSYSSYDDSGAFYGFMTSVVSSRSSLSSYSYIVRPGDTLSQIAEDFDVPSEALRRANPSAVRLLRVGQEILIPRAQAAEISVDGEPTISFSSVPSEKGSDPLRAKGSDPFVDWPEMDSYFVLPTKGWNWRDLHDENGIDIANACGSSIYAAAGGIVTEESSKDFWNRGYGNYLLIEHDNGTKTRYAHTLRNLVSIGEKVSQGQEIALMGNTGNVSGPTGCHLHFEVIGARNPFSLSYPPPLCRQKSNSFAIQSLLTILS